MSAGRRLYRLRARVDGMIPKRLIAASSIASLTRFVIEEMYEIDTPSAIEVGGMVGGERIKIEDAEAVPLPDKSI